MDKLQRDQIISSVAGRIGVDPVWLDSLINFETAGTWSTTIKNPYSSARGLLQFTDDSARAIGYGGSLDLVSKLPEFAAQMEKAVLPYLKKWGPYPTKQSLYMAVFYPKFRYEPPDTLFPDTVQKVNPGIKKISDYIAKVDRRAIAISVAKGFPMAILALAAGAALLLLVRK